jgi:hypothetical protein
MLRIVYLSRGYHLPELPMWLQGHTADIVHRDYSAAKRRNPFC